MSIVIARDGTAIAYSRVGRGSAVILVDGALCFRKMGQSSQLAALLSPHFTVYTYDRRGRGESGDIAPYAVGREVEDLAAILAAAGGTAAVWGMSSGAVLALEGAKHLDGITKVAVYEAPFIVDHSRRSTEEDWAYIDSAIAAGRRSEAVMRFLKSVGVPRVFRWLLRLSPVYSKLVAIAHTLPFDGAIVRENQYGKPLHREQWASIRQPVLVMDGGKSPTWIRRANQALASALPNASYRTLDGQTHMLKPEAHAPVLTEFFRKSGDPGQD